MEQKQIKLKIRDEDLKGFYSNLMQTSHTKEEFCLDFFNIFPPQGILTARVLMSPSHLKRVIKALSENMERYEGKFGKVEPAKDPQSPIGFQPK